MLALTTGLLLILPLIAARAKATRAGDTSSVTSIETTSITPPRRLAIYYGWPSLVNGAGGNITQATTVFTQFDMVVFGDGLEHLSHGDHTKTVTIINNLHENNAQVYGYIDLTLDFITVTAYVDEWAVITGVTGIFYDRAGQDYDVTHTRLISAVDYVHSKGLSVFVNAWNPDDVLSGTTRLRAGDWYLAESYAQCPDLDSWWNKSRKLMSYRDQTGVQIASSSTGDDSNCDNLPNDPRYRQALWATYLFGFEAFNFTNPLYSASGTSANHLCPLPPLPSNVGAMYLGPPAGPVTATDVVTYSRRTDTGTIFVFRNGITCDGGFSPNNQVFLPLIRKE